MDIRQDISLPELPRAAAHIRATTSGTPYSIAEIKEDAQAIAGPITPRTGTRLSSSLPPGLSSLHEEACFVVVCSMGQLLFTVFLSNGFVNQLSLVEALGLETSYSVWLVGAFLVANGVSVVISGSLADLTSPKNLIIGGFAWLSAWSIVGCFSVRPDRKVLYFFVQAFSGLAVGTICSSAMSMLGRVYSPSRRKNRVFSVMGSMIPLGFAVGSVLGGALTYHLAWHSAVIAIVTAVFAAIACWCIPSRQRLRPNSTNNTDSPTLKDFDFLGAGVVATGSGLFIFGLTQAVPTHWTPYTYSLFIAGIACFGLFGYVESRVKRPLVDNNLWKVPGFVPLMMAYFLAYGAYVGGCNFYAVTFFLTIQNRPPLIAALYLIPIGVGGSAFCWVVSLTLHRVPGHFILIASMFGFASGPAFFLPQTAHTIYWALSFPGLFIATLGPDLSFAAISVFITSNVPRAYQGSAGALLITTQNLSSAVFTSLAATIGQTQTNNPDESLDLQSLKDIWWFSLACSLAGALICVVFVRIPKADDRDHVQ